MKMSVSETANLLGVSVRTLQYYDSIGLVKPAEVSPAGYRFYDEGNLALLQQVLFYRELGFSLKDVADIVSRPDYDKRPALERRRQLLLMEREHIDGLLRLVDETLGGKKMSKYTSQDMEAAKAEYAAEAAEKWGKTDAYKESEKRHASYTNEKEAAIAEEADAIFADFAKIMDLSPASDEAHALVARWQEHITKYHYPCSKEILACLGQMYVGDVRFTENLDRFGDGTAKFMSEAIEAYCK